MSHRLVAAVAAALCAAACTKNFDGQISCSSDYNCPTAYHCGTDNKCHSGEATVQVSWVSPADSAAMNGSQTFTVQVGHPDGITSVSLLNGNTVIATKSTGTIATTAPAKVDFPVDTTVFPEGNATFTATATSAKGQTGAAPGRNFIFDRHESAPAPVASSPASPSNSTATTFKLKGTADAGPAPATIYVFADPACNGGNTAAAVASGPATTFLEPGIDVPMLANASTTYSVLSVDAAGNVSACSSSVASGTLTFTSAQMCASAITSAQIFSPLMQGCGGSVTFANRASLCAPGCRAATSEEWVANFGGTAPTHHYWTDDVLNFSNSGCGSTGCTTNTCFAGRGAVSPQFAACTAGQPMRVCAGTGAFNGADADGNTCTWSACGYNSIAPKEFFGGCSGSHDNTAGTLCVCNITHWFVSPTGDDTSAGNSSATPFKTITKALSVAQSGETIFVAPGTYSAGETFPLHVPGGVALIGDEPNRGAAATPTRIAGAGPISGGSNINTAIMPGAGSTVAGFTITSTVTSNFAMGLVPAGSGAILRNNTITGSTNNGIYVIGGTTNHAILLNALTANGGVGLGYIGSSAGGKAETNTITGNKFGVEYDTAGGDLGGGPAGSACGNVLSCNSSNDVWTNQSITINLANGQWDHNPPTSGCTLPGTDLCNSAGTATFLTTNASVVATGACP